MLRAEEKRRKPPTKAQKRNQMSTYLKNMGGYKHNQLKIKSYEEIQMLFDNEMRRVITFIPMDSEEVKSKKGIKESSKGIEDELKSDKSKKAESSEEKAKGSKNKMLGKKRAGKEQQQESSKRQRIKDDKETDEHEEVEEVDEAELKKHLVIVKDDDIAIDAIPLATKPPVIVEYKLLREGIMAHYKLIRADGSSKRYSSMIRMLYGIDREDLQTLWKLVKTKHGDTRPKDDHERVLWGDLKVMFEPDIKSDVWRNLQGYKVTIWKLFDSCGVHFVSDVEQKVMWLYLQLLRLNTYYVKEDTDQFIRDKDCSSYIDTGMRNFQACMEELEVSDVNSTGLRYTWNQKLKGASALFQPYQILDHSPAVLRVPMISVTKPQPLKFYNFLVHNTRFKEIVMDGWFLVQKAKVEWLQLSNENTAYFHKVVKIQALRNQIDSITTSNGVCVDGDQLTSDVANYMVRDVSDQEIHDAVFAIGDNKAPDQDGYSFAFFKEAWDIISGDVSRSIKEFFTNGVLLKELNHTS
ncbi:hypothetical protein Tco_0792946 [Tanacetum coccineum]